MTNAEQASVMDNSQWCDSCKVRAPEKHFEYRSDWKDDIYLELDLCVGCADSLDDLVEGYYEMPPEFWTPW